MALLALLMVGWLVATPVFAQTTDVLIMEVSGTDSFGDLDDELDAFYGAQPGFTTRVHLAAEGDLEPDDIAGVDLLVASKRTAYSDDEHALMAALLDAGGRIFFVTDNPVATNAFSVNTALAALGSGVTVTTDIVSDTGCGGTGNYCLAQVSSHPLTQGVTDFRWVAAAEVDGGTVLMASAQSGAPFVATEALGGGVIAVAGDGNITDGLFGPRDNGQFFLNLADVETGPWAPVPALPWGAWLALGLGLALAGPLVARRAGSE